MNKITHYLKTEIEYYQATKRGEKLFEIRKNDRSFQVGDRIFLRETIYGCPTGNTQLLEITYVLQGGEYGLDKDYCILQLKKIE